MENLLQPYEGSEPYVFVSYSRKDSARVFPILQRLQAEGINIFYNQDNDFIEDLPYNIVRRIQNCQCFIALHSNNSKNSVRCEKEIFFGGEPRKNKKIISIYLENVEPSLGISLKINRFPMINFYNSPEDESEQVLSKLANEVKKHLSSDEMIKKWLPAIAAVTGPVGVALSATSMSGIILPCIACAAYIPTGDAKTLKSYEGDKPYVFISYSHDDSDRVFKILGNLQDKGLRFWYDAGTKKGSEWQECIAEHIRDCECMIAFHSENSNKSEHCKDEISFAKWRKINKKIFSIYLEQVELSLGIQMAILRFQYLNFYEYATDKKKFFKDLLESPLLQPCLQ